jgi:hypothetical protein
MKFLAPILISAVVLVAVRPGMAQMLPSGDKPFFSSTVPVGQESGFDFEKRAVVLAGPSPFMMFLKMANLTPAQQAQIHQVMEVQGKKSAVMMEQLRTVEEQISTRLLSPQPLKLGDLAPLEKQAAQLKQQIDENLVETSLAVRNVLTSDQLKHLAQEREQLESLRRQIETLIGPGPSDIFYAAPTQP